MNNSTQIEDIVRAIEDFRNVIENSMGIDFENIGVNFTEVLNNLKIQEGLLLASQLKNFEESVEKVGQEIEGNSQEENLNTEIDFKSESDYTKEIQEHLDEIDSEAKNETKKETGLKSFDDDTNSEIENKDENSTNTFENHATELPAEFELADKSNDEIIPIMDNMAKIKPSESTNSPGPKEKLFIARNAMVGKKYVFSLADINDLDEELIQDVQELDELGLVFNVEDKTIVGTPNQDGEFAFPIIFELDHNPLFSCTLRVLVNPDPRSLWKDLDPPKDALYHKAHFDYDSKVFSNYNIIAGSHRGRSHAHSGTFRDDDFVLSPIGDKGFFIAVADGAGSSEYSREGSKIACDKACETMSNGLENSLEELIGLAEKLDANRSDKISLDALTNQVYALISESVLNARNGLISRAEDAGHELKDYSTTLLFSLILKLQDNYFIASYSIGDGIIAHVSDNIKLLSVPDGGQFAGQTRFLTMPEAVEDLAQRMKVTFVKELKGLYLMTDGISDPFFETDANMAEKEPWEKLEDSIAKEVDFDQVDVQEQFKDWINFWSPGNHDDRTIAFVGNKIND